MNDVLNAIATRSSARLYDEKPLEKDKLEAIIDAGLKAPTGMNLRELHFSIINGNNKILEELDAEKRRLRNQDKLEHLFHYEAPHLIIISAEDDARWGEVDAGIASENICLAAESMGIGSLIIGCIYDALHGEKQEYFEKALGIPAGKTFKIAVAVGYKKDDKTPHDYNKDQQVTYVD